MNYRDLSGSQTRQLVDVEQVFDTYRSARTELDQRYAGSMSWKTVGGTRYLYRKTAGVWKSLGPRSAETEKAFDQFHQGRDRLKDRVSHLAARLDEMAPVNRALALGRVPVTPARLIRALDKAGLMKGTLVVVGTNAMFAYERLAGVQIGSDHLATADIDLLFDARASLRVLSVDAVVAGLIGILRKVDRSFELTRPGGFRAANRDGYLVDLIQPRPRTLRTSRARHRIGSSQDDLEAVEIEGLVWLVNSPKLTATVIDERGFPLAMITPDPRAFSLHKAWVAGRADREPARRRRDDAQARLVADLLTTRLPHLDFGDSALGAIPDALRRAASGLVSPRPEGTGTGDPLTPNW